MAAIQFLKQRTGEEDLQGHLSMGHGGFELKENRFILNVKKKIFTMRVVRCWNRLPEKLWMPLEVFKTRVGAAWCSGRDPLPWQRDWKLIIPEVTSNPIHSMILLYDKTVNVRK